MPELALSHIKLLLDSLRRNDWYITAFPMDAFLGHDYAVVFEDLRAIDMGTKYYAVELTFIDMADEDRVLVIRANAYGVNHVEEMLDFFHIHGERRGRHPEFVLYNALNEACPTVFVGHPAHLQNHILDTVNRRDIANGNGIYCYSARHNGERDGRPMRRTEFNTAKTRLLRPALFDRLGGDDRISFCYSAEPNDERTDAQIIHDFVG